MKDKCPCIECISLAICNAKIKQMDEPDVTRFLTKKKCEDLSTYLAVDYINNRKEYKRILDEARGVFGLYPVSLRY